jgi:hypothetical protein
VIDGQDGDWGAARLYIKEIQGSLGLINDQDYLYLSMGLTNPTLQRQIMGQGFTLWLDAKEKKNKTFGVHFPLGMQEMMENMDGGFGGGRGGGMPSPLNLWIKSSVG